MVGFPVWNCLVVKTKALSEGPPPGTPEGYAVATPTTAGLPVSWTTSLPWMRFIGVVQPSPIHGKGIHVTFVSRCFTSI